MIMNTTEEVDLRFVAKNTRSGKEVRVDGIPAWTNSDPTAATLVVADDGKTAVATATDAGGFTHIECVGDADLGTGIRNLTAILDLNVIAVEEEADTVELVAGTPRPKPVVA